MTKDPTPLIALKLARDIINDAMEGTKPSPTEYRLIADEVAAMEAIAAGLPDPTIQIGQDEYYTVHQISLALGVPDQHLVDIVRSPDSGLHGRKIGKQWLISASEFQNWVLSGKFNYRPRKRRKTTLADDLEKSAAREEARMAAAKEMVR